MPKIVQLDCQLLICATEDRQAILETVLSYPLQKKDCNLGKSPGPALAAPWRL